MASSRYYHDIYKRKCSLVESCDDDLSVIQNVLEDIFEDMDDEISAVNREIDDLKSDLDKSVRHNSKFTASANLVMMEKEKGVTVDANLSIVVHELQDEISRIKAVRSKAVRERDAYYQKYKDKKAEESQEFLDNIF